MKHFIYSKTLWLAVLVGIIGVLQALPADALSPQASMLVHLALMGLIGVNRVIGTPTALTTSVTNKDTFQG